MRLWCFWLVTTGVLDNRATIKINTDTIDYRRFWTIFVLAVVVRIIDAALVVYKQYFN